MTERNGTDLREESGDKPVSDAGCEGGATGADLHGHNFGGVDPGDGAEGEGEDDCDAEDEEYTGD